MKTTIKQLTVGTILGLLLIVTNVRAEGKELVKASSHESIETTMKIESWMIDDNIWSNSSAFAFTDANEESLIIEDWMIDEGIWNSSSSIYMETENDIDLKIESWMTDSVVWNR